MTDLTPPGERVRPVLVNLQALRFVAAALVACHHIALALVPHGTASPDAVADRAFPFMAGVDVFFVISGFIMQHTAGGEPAGGQAAGRFLERRLVRIVPLYWLFTGLMLASTLVLARHVHHAVGSWAYVAASFLFIPWPVAGAGPRPMPATGEVSPLMPLGWTLNYEMLFYALFAGALLAPRRWRLPMLATVLVGLAVLPMLVRIDNLQLRYYAHPIVLEFLFGMGLAVAFARAPRSPVWMLATVVGVVWLAITHGYPGWRSLYLGVPAALVCAGAAFSPELPVSRISRGLRLLGDASYALYLSHPFVLRALELLLGDRRAAHPGLYAASALLACILASVGVHLWIEKPVTRGLRRLVPTRRPIAPGLAPTDRARTPS